MCSSNYALLVLHLFDVSNGHLCQQSIPFIVVMLVQTPPLFPLSHTFSAVGLFEYTFTLYLCLILYTPVLIFHHLLFSQLLNLYVIQIPMCTSPPCSLQSLSLDLLNKMSTSLAQNKTMVKLIIKEDIDCLMLDKYNLSHVQNGKLFTRHLLLGLTGNNTLTDLTLNLPPRWWDWPEGEYNVLHRFT